MRGKPACSDGRGGREKDPAPDRTLSWHDDKSDATTIIARAVRKRRTRVMPLIISRSAMPTSAKTITQCPQAQPGYIQKAPGRNSMNRPQGGLEQRLLLSNCPRATI